MTAPSYKVSALVSVYQSERFIVGCLEDLLRQTLGDGLEIIIINSGSQQNEDAIIRRYMVRHANIVYLKTDTRETLYKAWNRGIQVARAPYLAVANTDDRHRVDALERLSCALDTHSDVDMVYADSFISRVENETYEQCDRVPAAFPDVGSTDRYTYALHGGGGHQAMWRRRLHDRFGFFDETLEVEGDYEFFFRVSGESRFLHLDDTLGVYYLNPDSLERRDYERRIREIIEVTCRYLPTLKGNRVVWRRMHDGLCRQYLDLANFYIQMGQSAEARRAAQAAVRWDWRRFKPYVYLAALCLPTKLTMALWRRARRGRETRAGAASPRGSDHG